MSGPDGVAGDRLRSFVERIERLEEEIKALRPRISHMLQRKKNGIQGSWTRDTPSAKGTVSYH